jgi:predicted RNA-binding Zn-ribbon protein involved in translation (DUF1610 family)
MPETTTLVRINGSDIAVNLTEFRTLPNCFYCPDCGAVHFQNDISFAADNNGRAWGSAWLEHGYINTETNDEESSYENMTYSCDSCENDITDELRACETWQRNVDQLLSANQSVRDLQAQINNESKHVSFILNRHSTAETSRYLMNIIDRDGIFINFVDTVNNVNDVMINPHYLEAAKSLMNSVTVKAYKFNYNNPNYATFIKLYKNIAARIINSNEPPSNNIYTNEICINIVTEAINNTTVENVTTVAHEIPTNTTPTETPEPDPMNSMVIVPTHHRRWRENSLDNISECKHCKYLFEADNELDSLVCPKCGKDT